MRRRYSNRVERRITGGWLLGEVEEGVEGGRRSSVTAGGGGEVWEERTENDVEY